MDTEINPEPTEAAAGGMVVDDPGVDENAVCFRLGDYRDADMLTKAGMAKVFQCSSRTLLRMIERSDLPPPMSLAGRSVWRVGNLNEWLADSAGTRQTEAQKQMKKMHRL
jgi:predicted DNA-binding transcriptional regulator AlpA